MRNVIVEVATSVNYTEPFLRLSIKYELGPIIEKRIVI
jgi:hypothetical protein